MENDEKELKEMEIRALFPLKRKEKREKAPPNLTWTFEG